MAANVTLADLISPSAQDAVLHFVDEGSSSTLGDLWKRGESVAQWNYVQGGVPVAMVLSNTSACVAVVIGAIRAGITLVSLPAPPRGVDPAWYTSFVRSACRQTGASTLAVDARYLPLLPLLDDIAYVSYEDIAGVGNHGPSSAAEFSLVQFTSGSTANPKGVVLGQDKLVENIQAILDRLKPEPGDGACTWLPISHDMGLIGMLLVSLAASGPNWANRVDVVMMTPEGFLRNPERWLLACSEYGSTITSSPNFGFELAARRRGSAPLDLSALRVCITGAEPIRSVGLRRFADTFDDSGFSSEAFCPAYGLAEASLAVTIMPPEKHWSSVTLDPVALAQQEVDFSSDGIEVVGCGPTLTGTEVSIDSTNSGIGEILVRGPSTLDCYSNGDAGTDAEGWLRTSDLGFCHDGLLHVVGRSDDVLFVAGRNIYALDVEEQVAGIPGIRLGRVVVAENGEGELVVVAEPEVNAVGDRASCSQLADTIRRKVRSRIGVAPRTVAIVPRGHLPMTSSGKTQRAVAMTALEKGSLDVMDGSIGHE